MSESTTPTSSKDATAPDMRKIYASPTMLAADLMEKFNNIDSDQLAKQLHEKLQIAARSISDVQAVLHDHSKPSKRSTEGDTSAVVDEKKHTAATGDCEQASAAAVEGSDAEMTVPKDATLEHSQQEEVSPKTVPADIRDLENKKPSGSSPTEGASSDSAVPSRQVTFDKVAEDVGHKMREDPTNITSQDASRLESAEHRLLGVRPPSGSMSAEAKRMALANERGVDPVVAAEHGVKAATSSATATATKQAPTDIPLPATPAAPKLGPNKTNEEAFKANADAVNTSMSSVE